MRERDWHTRVINHVVEETDGSHRRSPALRSGAGAKAPSAAAEFAALLLAAARPARPTLNLKNGDVRELLERMPMSGPEDFRLLCVRELSIFVLHVLEEWVAEEGDRHGQDVL